MSLSRKQGIFRRQFGAVAAAGLLVAATAGAAGARQPQEVRRERQERIVRKDESQRPSETETRVVWESHGERVEVRSRNVEFTEDGSRVKSIARDGYLYVDEARGGARRAFKVLPGDGGELQRTLYVNGKSAPFDAAAQESLGKLLVEFLHHPEDTNETRVRP